ncbi:MAG: alpha/beta fold hydrolase [Amaricoccus sp.]|uniref:alpha/beta fold hydrolase n=1 Tax=Amaricoccus sp. TaxID=1872485 RepID=UPI0039E3123A
MPVSRRRFLAFAAGLPAACTAACTASPDGPMALGQPDDDRLVMHAFLPEGAPKAVILALHGYGDAGDLTFGRAAAAWTARGIAVFAPDQRGFGSNPSRRHWPGVDVLASDARAHAHALRRRFPDLPLTVVGHSMGGGVALVAAGQGLDADGLVLAGPAIAGGEALGEVARGAARLLATALPERRWTGEGVVRIQPTDDLDALRTVAADPRHFGDPSSRELYGLVLLMDRAAAAAPSVHLPTVVMMGARDQVLRPESVEQVALTIPGLTRYILYPRGWHWLFRDRQAPRVWADTGDIALGVTRSDFP